MEEEVKEAADLEACRVHVWCCVCLCLPFQDQPKVDFEAEMNQAMQARNTAVLAL
jgi:hypothetical protein